MTDAPARSPAVIAGFWQRAFAFLLDGLVLGLVGLALGWLLGDAFVRQGSYGGLVGPAVAWLYFALMNSRLGGGQTLGKRALGIRVISASGAGLGVGAGFCRAAIYCLPYFDRGAALDTLLAQSSAAALLADAIAAAELCDIYLFVFNRSTRQSLHDLAVNSRVVEVGAEPAPQPGRRLWPGHAAVVAVLLVGFATPWHFNGSIESVPLDSFREMQQEITKEAGVLTAGIQVGTSSLSMRGESHSTRFLTTQVFVDSNDIDGEALADRIARIELRLYPSADNIDTLRINVVHGYNFGIATSRRTRVYAHSPAEWRKRLSTATPI